MKYKLKKNYTTDPEVALEEILRDRGVTDIENFMNPSPVCEFNPYLSLFYHNTLWLNILFLINYSAFKRFLSSSTASLSDSLVFNSLSTLVKADITVV